MAEMEQMPFLKQLVDSDRKVRDKALDSLRLFLTSGRQFSDLELLKLWRGLFFCMFHTPPPHAAPQLASALSSILLALPTSLFNPFNRAFWRTHAALYPTLDGHRLDKFLLLMRRYVGAGMEYLCLHGWRENGEGGMKEWLHMMVEEGVGPLSVGMGAEGEDGEVILVGDGVRYHVLDVWVDEMVKVKGGRMNGEVRERLLEPARGLAKEGRTKTVRRRARNVLDDERLEGWEEKMEKEGGDEEWEGLG